MLNYQNKIFTKLISLILTQVFLLTGAVYPGSSSNKSVSSIYIYAKTLRVPMMATETRDRLTEAMSVEESAAEIMGMSSHDTIQGRNLEVFRYTLSILDMLAIDIKNDKQIIVDFGVGFLPLTTIELFKLFKTINPKIEVYGTEIPTSVAKAYITSDALLNNFKDTITKLLKLRQGVELIEVILAVGQNNEVSTVVAGLKENGAVGYMTIAVNPGLDYRYYGEMAGRRIQHPELFNDIVNFLGKDLVTSLVTNADTTHKIYKEGNIDMSIRFNPVAQDLENAGCKFAPTNDPSTITQGGAAIIFASHVFMLMTVEQRNKFMADASRALKPGGLLVITDHRIKDDIPIPKDVLSITSYYQLNEKGKLGSEPVIRVYFDVKGNLIFEDKTQSRVNSIKKMIEESERTWLIERISHIESLYNYVKHSYEEDRLIKKGYHRFAHSMETTRLALESALERGAEFTDQELFELVLAGMLHDFVPPGRKRNDFSKVLDTIELIKKLDEMKQREIFGATWQEMGVDISHIIVYIVRTDYGDKPGDAERIEAVYAKALGKINIVIEETIDKLAVILHDANLLATSLLLTPGEEDSDDFIGVVQGEYGFTSANSKSHRIKSCWASESIILALYNKEKKIGMIAHIDQETDAENSLQNIISDFKALGIDARTLSATIIGRFEPSNMEFGRKVYSVLKDDIKISDIKEDYYGFEDRQVMLDTNAGLIYNLKDIIQKGPYFDDMMERVKKTFDSSAPRILRRCYDERSLGRELYGRFNSLFILLEDIKRAWYTLDLFDFIVEIDNALESLTSLDADSLKSIINNFSPKEKIRLAYNINMMKEEGINLPHLEQVFQMPEFYKNEILASLNKIPYLATYGFLGEASPDRDFGEFELIEGPFKKGDDYVFRFRKGEKVYQVKITQNYDFILETATALVTVDLLQHEQEEDRAGVTANAVAIFDLIGYGTEWEKGSVILNLGSGANPIMWKNFINVDKEPLDERFRGRFFSADYLEDDFMKRLQEEQLKSGEQIKGVLLYNLWAYITGVYASRYLTRMDIQDKEKASFKLHFYRMWKNILPEGGDFVFVDFMPPEGRLSGLIASEEIVLKVEGFIKDVGGDEIEKITRIKDKESGYIVGLAVRKRGDIAKMNLFKERFSTEQILMRRRARENL